MTRADSLVGRAAEQRELEELLLAAPTGGRAVMLTGDPGIGKSALQAYAVSKARDLGYQVLRAVGTESEAHLPFAALHQLIHTNLHRADGLPPIQRDSLLTAFGRTQSTGIDPFLISLAALELFGALAAAEPLLICLDDVQWVDTATMDIIAFVARRIEAEPVVLLLSARPNDGAPFDSTFDLIDLRPLDAVGAETLLFRVAPDLTSASRRRVLSAASGNPLALLELPTATPNHQDQVDTSGILPVTARLERAFADRAYALPLKTRTLLTVAAVDDGKDASEVIAATAIVLADDSVSFKDLEPAVSTHLIRSDGVILEFHHPLVRSAIHRMATISDRRAAHDALVQVLAAHPDRAVWHRAVSLTAPDENVAVQLEAAAQRSRQRGAVASAVEWFERAAVLSPDPASCFSRLLSAAEVAFELGRFELLERLRARIVYSLLRTEDQHRLLWLDGVFNDCRAAEPRAIKRMLELAREAAALGDTPLAMHLYVAASRVTWWGDPGIALRSEIVAAAEALDVPRHDLQLSLVRSTGAAVNRGRLLLDSISTWDPSEDIPPETKGQMGTVTFCAGDFVRAIEFTTAPMEALRARGQLSLLAQTLSLRGWAALFVGSFGVAQCCEEAARLSEETGQLRWAAISRVGEAALTGLRTGEMATASLLDAERVALDEVVPLSSLLAGIQFARGVTFLSAGDFSAAYSAFERMWDDKDPAYHRMLSLWSVDYFAEAAMLTGHRSEICELLDRLEPVYDECPSIGIRVPMDYAHAVVADSSASDELFETALTRTTSLPWHRARLQLAHGSWLRRTRRSAESRDILRSARDTFDSLGMREWSKRADRELMASGERQRPRQSDDWSSLSAQEAHIAELAAQGKTNREIGRELYMSHRTVGAHLSHIFPKLGINSRAQLGRIVASTISR